MKKYRVTLAEDERVALGQRVRSGRGSARELTRVRILLKADRGTDGPDWADEAIAAALDVSRSTVERVRKRFACGGLEAALRPRPPRREYRRKLDGEQEAHLIALACSPPPLGRRFWTLRLLAERGQTAAGLHGRGQQAAPGRHPPAASEPPRAQETG